jgi:hypothetical protein
VDVGVHGRVAVGAAHQFGPLPALHLVEPLLPHAVVENPFNERSVEKADDSSA